MRLCAAYKVFNGELFLAYSMRSIYDFVDQIVVFISTKPWNGPVVPPDRTVDVLRTFPDPLNKIRYVVGDFRYSETPSDGHANELLEMTELLEYVRREFPSVTHYLYIDADEVYRLDHLLALRQLLLAFPAVGEVYCAWRCYWKSFKYWISPVEPSRALVAFRLTAETRFTGIRNTNMEPRILVSPEHFYVHHFSYAITSEMVRRKMEASSHCNDIVDQWFERVWLAWDHDRGMENLHPVIPPHYKQAVVADESALPDVMKDHPFYGKDIV